MWTLFDRLLTSRLLLDVDLFPGPEQAAEAIEAAGTELVIVDPAATGPHAEAILTMVRELGVDLLPRLPGPPVEHPAAYRAADALDTPWRLLHRPDPNLVATLARDGFQLFCTARELHHANDLVTAGAAALLIEEPDPLAWPSWRTRWPDLPLIGAPEYNVPSEATRALEAGLDGVRIGVGIAEAGIPAMMAEAFADAVLAGRLAFEAGPRGEAPGGISFWNA
jgi:thiazole synthase